MHNRYLVLVFIVLLAASLPRDAHAQKAALSVNAGDALCLGTIGVGFDYAVSRKWTVGAQARINPWTYHKGDADKQTQFRHQTYSLGARFWPWYVYSGFWFGAKAQYQEYNRGGFGGRLATEEGDAFGIGLELGYNLILSPKWNLNFGLGGWSGYTDYVSYECPYCGRKTHSGGKFFFLPNELIIAIQYVF